MVSEIKSDVNLVEASKSAVDGKSVETLSWAQARLLEQKKLIKINRTKSLD